MEALVMLSFGIIFLQILVAIILGAIKLRTFFIQLGIKYAENRKHLAIYLAIHVAVSFVFCCIAFLCYEDHFSRDVGVLIAALSITGICAVLGAVLALIYFSLLFSRKNWIISFVFLICGILSGIAGFKSAEFSVECFSSMLRPMFEFVTDQGLPTLPVVEIKQTKCVGCGKLIKDPSYYAVCRSEWEGRGYCSAECREKNPNKEVEKIEYCSSCHRPRSYCERIITSHCIKCRKEYQERAHCSAINVHYSAGVEGKCPECVSEWMMHRQREKMGYDTSTER